MGRKSGMASALLWTPKAWSIVAISFGGVGPNEPLAHFAVTGASCRGALVAATRADRLGAAVGRAAAQEYLQRLETAGEASAAASPCGARHPKHEAPALWLPPHKVGGELFARMVFRCGIPSCHTTCV